MAKPVLYYDDVSPPARSCLLLIKLLDIDVEYKYVDLFKGAQHQTDFLKINPTHTVPTLVHDAFILTDSHAILMYLSDTFAKDDRKTLFPDDYKHRIQIINRLFFNCSVLFRRDSEMMTDIFRRGFANIDLQHHERKIHETYSIMEQYLMETHKFMAGTRLTIADIALVATLSTVDLMFPVAEGSVLKWPLLCEWFQSLKSLPEYRINQIGLDKLKVVIEEIGKFKFPLKTVTNT